MSTDDWRHQAACRGLDGEIFFPTGTSAPALADIEYAKSICRQCPVIAICGLTAVHNGWEHGVFGGMDEKERHNLKRRLARQQKEASA